MIGLVTLAILSVCFGCCVFCGYKSLKLAIDVIDASADFLAKTKRIILVPILYFFLTVVVVVIWFVCLMLVLSMNKITVSKSIPQMKNIEYENETYYYLMWYMLFGILWLTAWLEYTC